MAWDATGALTQYLNIGAQPAASLGPLLSALAVSVQNAIEAQLGRTLETYSYFEAYNGNDRPYLCLRHDPIQAVSAVSLNGVDLTVLDPKAAPVFPAVTQVSVASDRAMLYRTDGGLWYSGIQNVLVQYEAGLTEADGETPEALRMAVVYWAGQLFRDRDRLGISSQQMTGQVTAYTREVPDFVAQLIAPFRRPFLPVN